MAKLLIRNVPSGKDIGIYNAHKYTITKPITAIALSDDKKKLVIKIEDYDDSITFELDEDESFEMDMIEA